jgi:hypothetical protein
MQSNSAFAFDVGGPSDSDILESWCKKESTGFRVKFEVQIATFHGILKHTFTYFCKPVLDFLVQSK